MTRRSVEIELKANARAAKREIDAVAKSLGKVDDGFEDVESAGKKAARAINQSADSMIDEIGDTKRAVDRMATALGDLEADPREVVADLKRMGLTAQDIEADADDLAAAIRRIDDVKVSARDAGFDDLDQAMGRTTDNSRVASTAIGGIGNSISELPGVGSLGPVAESMGMLAENALEGEANLKGLVVAGGGLAALGFTMGLISKAMQSVADTDAFNDDQIESFRDAVQETEEGLSGVNEMLRETKEITGRAGGIGPFFEDTKDITKDLIAAGVEYDEWIQAVERGGPALDAVTGKLQRHRDAMVEERNELQRNNESTAGYEETISDLDNAVEIAIETRKNYAKATEENVAWEKWAADSTIETADAVTELTDRWADLKSEFDDRDAFLDIADSLDDVEQKGNDAWLAAATGAENADAAARDYERSVNDAKRRVMEYADEVGDIPEEAVSEILALIDEGALSTAERRLADLERERTTRLRIQTYYEDSGYGRFVPSGRDTGGTVAPGQQALVAERRPELVNGQLLTEPTMITGPADVTSGAQTAAMLGRAGTVSAPTYITVNAPAGIDLDWLSRLHYRRTGRPT